MSLKLGRAQGIAEVNIDYIRCTVCGLCVKVCKGGPLYLDSGKVMVDQARGFGCIACGQCVAVCPHECITVKGRDLFPEDIIPIPEKSSRANYAQLQSLLLARRSVRDYVKKEVAPEVINQIIETVTTAPMGIPPSEVSILVLSGQEKVQVFAADIIDRMRKMKWLFSPAMLYLWRPLVGKEGYQMFKSFLVPLIDIIIKKHEQGIDWLLYDAPLAIYFYTSTSSDSADPIIAATYAMLAAELLGLGSCMIGTIAPMIKQSKPLKQKYGIPIKSRQGIMVIFGYPAVTYHQAIKRRLATVKFF